MADATIERLKKLRLTDPLGSRDILSGIVE